jgi:hypothetical protein
MTRGGLALQPSPAGKPLVHGNGDQVRDLALWVPAQPGGSEYGPLQLNVLDGRTGTPLWPEPVVKVHHPDRLIWPEPAVADLDGDGSPEVLATRHGGYEERLGGYRCELLAVDARDGSIRWTWNWRAGFPQLWPPVMLARGHAGPPWVCLVVQTNDGFTLLALDANGREQVRRPLKLPGRQFESGRFVWRASDVDGDGREELLFLDDGQLCAAGGDALDVRWRWPLPDEAVRLVDLRATTPGLPVTLTVWSGQEVFGLDGAAGQPIWRCSVTDAPRSRSSDLPEVRWLAAPGPGLARVQLVPSTRTAYSASSAVRQAWPAAANGHYLAPRPTPGTYAALPAIAVPTRRLPWAQSDTVLIFAGGVTLLVVAIPAALVGWAMRRRSWLLGLLPLCYAGLSLLLPWRAMLPAVVLLGYAVWLGVSARRSRRWEVFAVAVVDAGLAVAIGLGSAAPRRHAG